MSRIERHFSDLKAKNTKGFIPFVTAGDPSLDESLAVILKLADLGASVIELGVPFSDPMADGPTIQLSSQRALENGVNLPAILDLVREFRRSSEVPIVLFGYLNPLMAYGIEKIASDASIAGVDGFLIADIIGYEAAEISATFKQQDLDVISLIAPTTTDERLERIARTSSGFLYAVSRAGVTGARTEITNEAEKLVNRARSVTDMPIAVGFGISTRQQIEQVWQYADAAVVGSAIVNEIAKSDGQGIVERVETFVRGLLPPVAKGETNP